MPFTNSFPSRPPSANCSPTAWRESSCLREYLRISPERSPPDRVSLSRLERAFRCATCCSWAADEAEAILVNAAGAVAGGEEVQPVDHVVVAAYEGLIDPCPLQNRQLPGSFHDIPALPVVHRRSQVAAGEPHRERASGDVIRAQVPGVLGIEVADGLVGFLATRSSVNGVDPHC